MKVLVLGSGLLGVTTAYELARRGAEVTVIDRQPACSRETSFANGGQLSYSHAEPWATAAVLKKLPKWLIDPDAPLVFRFRADLAMMRWGLSFLRNCTPARAQVNTVNLLRLGLYSRDKLAELRKETGIQFDFSDRGILHIYSTDADFDHAKRHNEFQAKFGGQERVLTRAEVLSMEPALTHTSRTIVGGIHAHMDESGDAQIFCAELSKYISERYGVKFLYNTTINSFITQGPRIAEVVTSEGNIPGDAFVMAMGSYSPIYLKQLGINVPIYPMKGCSITVPAGENAPHLSLTDGTYKVVYSRLGNRLRIAGTAEFAGYDPGINEKRIAPVLRAASELLPQMDFTKDISKWACLRPSTPDGPPILGRSPIANLFLNTGHGTLGWTQAAGSAAIVADIMENKMPAILLHGLTLERYGS